MKPIRVLHFRREVPIGGGPETLILGVARCIDRTRFDLKVAVFDTHSPPDSLMSVGLQQMNTPIITVPVKHRMDVSAIRCLARLLDEHEIDVIHTHDHRTNLIGYLAARLRPTALVATLHQPLRRHWWLRHFEMLDEFVVRRFDRILPVAEMIREELIAKHPRLADRTIAVHNGVDLRRFDYPIDVARVREALSITPDQKLFLTLGRLSDDKGLPYLLESVQLVVEQRQDVRWAIAGQGPLEERLRAKTRAMGLDSYVSFLGFRQDVPDLLAAADMLVVASTSEGCPVVILEAMASRCPVICTRVGGSAEVVADGRTGIVVEPRRPKELAEAMLRLVGDAARRDEMGRQACQMVHEHFTIETMVRRFEQIYDDLARSRT